MMGKKIINAAILALLFVSVIIMIFGVSFRLAAFDEDFYREEFAKYSVYEKLKGHDVELINKGVLDYLLREDSRIIAGNFFNEREKEHLSDVKSIIRKVLFLYHISFFFFCAIIFLLAWSVHYNIKKMLGAISKIFLFVSLSTIFLAAALFFASFTGFENVFQKFHETFFMPGTFVFDPSFEKIVVLYPENLFFDLLAKILAYAFFSSVILLLLSSAFFARKFLQNFFKKFRRKTT